MLHVRHQITDVNVKVLDVTIVMRGLRQSGHVNSSRKSHRPTTISDSYLTSSHQANL